MPRIITSLVVLLIFNTLNAQIDYNKIEYKELSPCQIDIDTDSVFIIHKRYATIYLRQSDIKEYIDQNKRTWSNRFSNITGLLNIKKPQYIITDWWYDYDDEYRKKKFGDIDYKNQDWYYFRELYYVVADLIHDGKFMITKKGENKPILKGLCIKKKDGFYGTEYLEFLLPNGKSFWNIVTVLGE
ncbi:hypothetical protein E2605_19005 [Dysgonomonas capnocytophagoides]|uniref:Uncharacterized protein n=1 Tax=Dysgonomonas capnocytophagoides TaxID=45254 RepID=A0A4Y8KVS8_9BACT|nr:hypothetical protein [Dysgonomonas capnocytophagoides]TFD91928.1 hypothetical protein E2605_19005 [Dysgonomonas capnocytophagoides]